jgi:hypothetical protein
LELLVARELLVESQIESDECLLQLGNRDVAPVIDEFEALLDAHVCLLQVLANLFEDAPLPLDGVEFPEGIEVLLLAFESQV